MRNYPTLADAMKECDKRAKRIKNKMNYPYTVRQKDGTWNVMSHTEYDKAYPPCFRRDKNGNLVEV